GWRRGRRPGRFRRRRRGRRDRGCRKRRTDRTGGGFGRQRRRRQHRRRQHRRRRRHEGGVDTGRRPGCLLLGWFRLVVGHRRVRREVVIRYHGALGEGEWAG